MVVDSQYRVPICHHRFQIDAVHLVIGRGGRTILYAVSSALSPGRRGLKPRLRDWAGFICSFPAREFWNTNASTIIRHATRAACSLYSPWSKISLSSSPIASFWDTALCKSRAAPSTPSRICFAAAWMRALGTAPMRMAFATSLRLPVANPKRGKR